MLRAYVKALSTDIFLFRRDKTMVAVLTAVVLMLVVCHAPRTVINLYESYNIGKLSNLNLFAN